MTLKLLEFLTYLCCGIICLVMGIVLLGVHYDYSEVSSKGYASGKKFVAYAAFLDVFNDAAVIFLQNFHADYLLVNYYLSPLIFFFQALMGASSMLFLLRYPRITMKKVYLFLIPVLLVSTAHYAGFFIRYGFVFDVELYSEYVMTSFSRILRYMLYAIIFVELGYLGMWLVEGCRSYNRMIGAYYSGNDMLKNKKLTSVLYAYFLYLALSAVNLLSFSEEIIMVQMWVTTALFIVFAIALINLQRLFSLVSPAFTYQQELLETETPQKSPAAHKSEAAEPAEQDKTPGKSASIDEIVRTWMNSSKKLYLQEGLTLGDTANQMGISQRLLSDFLNNIYDMNFNSWINGLRIEEIQKQLASGTKSSMAELAQMAGFADASAMSKAFKKITGMTPSHYRASHVDKC